MKYRIIREKLQSSDIDVLSIYDNNTGELLALGQSNPDADKISLIYDGIEYVSLNNDKPEEIYVNYLMLIKRIENDI